MKTCLLCRNDSSVRSLRMHGGYSILYCSDCRLRFSDPMKEPDSSFYKESALYENRSQETQNNTPSHDWRYETCLSSLGSQPGRSLLDVGCGDGTFLVRARDQGFKVFGIDFDDRAVSIAKKIRKLEQVECGRWDSISRMSGWEQFDVITMFDVLEHMAAPGDLAATAHALLKPNGTMAISVPRFDRYPRMFDIEYDFPPHHFTLWTSKAMIVLLEKTGCEDIRIVEKPLGAEDVLEHIKWRVKRLARRLRRGSEEPSGRPDPRTAPAGMIKTALKIFEKPLLLMLGLAVLFLRAIHLARGHTLLVLAKKKA